MNKPVAVSKTKSSGTSFSFEGKNLKTEQIVRGEVVAKDEADARAKLTRRQIRVIQIAKVKKQRQKKISQADITVFTKVHLWQSLLPNIRNISIIFTVIWCKQVKPVVY